MSKRLKCGMRMSMLAKLCDIPKSNPEERWSYIMFGNECDSKRITGTITKKVSSLFITFLNRLAQFCIRKNHYRKGPNIIPHRS